MYLSDYFKASEKTAYLKGFPCLRVPLFWECNHGVWFVENVERLQEAEIRKFDWVFSFDLSITLTVGQTITPVLLVGKNTLCFKNTNRNTKTKMDTCTFKNTKVQDVSITLAPVRTLGLHNAIGQIFVLLLRIQIQIHRHKWANVQLYIEKYKHARIAGPSQLRRLSGQMPLGDAQSCADRKIHLALETNTKNVNTHRYKNSQIVFDFFLLTRVIIACSWK